jgi:hypothetical protein
MSRLVGILASPNLFESADFLNLSESRQEARRLAEALEQYWSPTSGTRLKVLADRVTHEELVSHLHESVRDTEPDDIFLFYYSGHGFTLRSKSYLALSDSVLNQASSTCIAVEQIVEILSPVQKKLILIDACKSGGISWEGFSLSTLSSLPAINEFAPNRSAVLISAGSAYEDSYGGLFTNSLIDGLRYFAHAVGKVDISVYFEYVCNEVSAKSKGRQNPSISFSGASLSLEFSVSPPNDEGNFPTAINFPRRTIGTGVRHMKQTNVLAVFANPKGSSPLRLENEDRVMRESVKLSLYREHIGLEILHAARVDDFARALLEKEYQIVHFSGHGTGKGLAFENESQQTQVVPKDALTETLSAYSPPIECVLLNACYSNVNADSLSMGVPYTIVMNGPISDEGATEFTRGFYDAIGAGKSIEFAYKEGCRRIRLKTLPDGATPVLVTKSAG